MPSNMKIAVEGCCHGKLDATYEHIKALEAKNNYHIDLLLICGDFQAIRNHQDLQCMAVPPKYRQLGDFHKYYTGEKKAPILTIVIGGNHESSNYLWELYHGGWLAPNIYFLGYAGCVQVNGIRIAGASGIFNSHDFHKGHYEKLPYNNSAMRSIYHIREFNIRRLSLLSSPDVFLSHDWPQSIEHYGDIQKLLRCKPWFRADVNSGKLGSPALMGLFKTLQPTWWFAAHLHVRFEATMVHEEYQPMPAQPQMTVNQNPEEIMVDADDVQLRKGDLKQQNSEEIVLNDDEVYVSPPLTTVSSKVTKFLALDKCLPQRQFLEVLNFPLDSTKITTEAFLHSPRLTYDPEWLAITRVFHPYMSTTLLQPSFPDESQVRHLIKKELEWVEQNAGKQVLADGLVDILVYQQFTMTALGPGKERENVYQQPPYFANPQTEAFCDMLELENKIDSSVAFHRK